MTPDVLEAQEHFERCEACRNFATEMRHLGDWIGTAVLRPEAPSEVRERLFATVARARAGTRMLSTPLRRHAWKIVAAAVVALAAGTLWLSGPLGRRALPGDYTLMFAEDHMRALTGAGIASSDSAAVAAWLAHRLSFAMHVPAFPDAELKGARLCIMDGRTGAAVEYRIDGQAVSYYVLPEPDGRGATAFSALRHSSHAGYHVVAWHEPGLLHALVASLPEARLAALARYCIERALGLLRLAPESLLAFASRDDDP